MYDLCMARGGNKSTAGEAVGTRSGSAGTADNVLYGATEIRDQPAGTRQREAMQELKAAHQELTPAAEAIETEREQVQQKLDAARAATDSFADSWSDHGDKIAAFVDTIATNLSKDFFDFADHKPGCDRSPCSCGYDAAKEYAAEVYRTATGEDAPA